MAIAEKQWVPGKKKTKGWDAQKGSLCQIYFQVRRFRRRAFLVRPATSMRKRIPKTEASPKIACMK